MVQQASDEAVTPKLSMKLLQAHIQELREENIQITQRLAAYEMNMAALMRSHQEIAVAANTVVVPVEATAQPPVQIQVDSSLSSLALIPLPRAERHRTSKKSSIWALLLHMISKALLPRRKRHFVR